MKNCGEKNDKAKKLAVVRYSIVFVNWRSSWAHS